MRFAMSGLYQMRELRSFPSTARSSTSLIRDLSKLRKNHRARPEFTAKALRSVKADDGVTHSGVSLDGTRIWKIYEPILWVYDLEESEDVPHAQVPC